MPRYLAVVPVIAALAAPAAAQAAFPAGAQVQRSAETGQVSFVTMPAGRPDPRPQGLAPGAAPADVGRAYLARHGDDLGVGGPSAVRAVRSTAGERGGRTLRYQQTLKGIEVMGGEFNVRLDRDDNVTSLNGEATPPDEDFDATPDLDGAAAERTAIALVARGSKERPGTLRASGTDLKVFDPRVIGGPGFRRATLAYTVTVASTVNDELVRLVVLDADTGNKLAIIDQTQELKKRSVCDGANTPGAQVPCTAPVLNEGGTYGGSVADVKPAYDYAGATYDFFKSRFNRDSLDGKGLALKSTVRYCYPAAEEAPCPLANAFWNGTQMAYGDTYASADDVVGHELSHGFTQFTSGLYYYFQSGAINESMSDVFGELIDQKTVQATKDTAADKWKIGEALPADDGDGSIRNMKNPTLFEDPDRMGSDYYALTTGDSGGVHTNSGVNNKAAFLMTDGGTFNGRTVTGLGLEKVARLYYVVETEYLTSGSEYLDLGLALGAACDALVGTNSFVAANCVEVRDAVAATEMLTDEELADDEPPCAVAGQFPKYSYFDDMEQAVAARGWTSSVIVGTTNPWYYWNGYATSGKMTLSADDLATRSDSAMAMKTGVVVPANSYLRLRHAYQFDFDDFDDYDGGVIEYSVSGGAWQPLDAPGYSGTISSEWDNPLAGRDAYTYVSAGYVAESIPLTGLGGKTVRFRFRLGTDSAVGAFGWVIDDVGVHTCGADTTAPATTLTTGPAEGSFKNTTTASFAFTSSEKGSKFECKVDAAPFFPCRSPEAVGPLAAGAHTFQVRAVDPAGLKDASPSVRHWTIDLTKPVLTISSPAAGATVTDTTPAFTFSANEPATFNCYIDGVLRKTGCTSGWAPATALSKGSHTFRLDAKDRAGNANTLSRSFTVA
ncbi:MAG TPA: M4 family metallopeptidase [Solirubrobacteraceae bacterium]